MEQKSETNVIESLITHKTTKDGRTLKSPRFEIGIGGKKYSTFDPVMIEGLKVGDVIKINLTKDGDYWQISGIELQDSIPVSSSIQQPNYLESPKEPTKHIVIDGVSGEELRKALNLASEQFNVFATNPFPLDSGLKNPDGSKIYKWYALLYMR